MNMSLNQKMYILSFHVWANVVQKLCRAKNNLDTIDTFDHDIVDIYNENQIFHRFVANKVVSIRISTSPKDWYYVTFKSNPHI